MPRQGKNIYLRKDVRCEGRYQKEKVNANANTAMFLEEHMKKLNRSLLL